MRRVADLWFLLSGMKRRVLFNLDVHFVKEHIILRSIQRMRGFYYVNIEGSSFTKLCAHMSGRFAAAVSSCWNFLCN